MEYKVIPFHPTITDKGGATQASKELQTIIQEHVIDGWEFVSLESMTTTVTPTGCASFLGNKSTVTTVQLVIFKK